jgi:hypothetical protein
MGRGGSTEKSLDGTCVPETPNYRHKWVSELFIQVALLICKKKHATNKIFLKIQTSCQKFPLKFAGNLLILENREICINLHFPHNFFFKLSKRLEICNLSR